MNIDDPKVKARVEAAEAREHAVRHQPATKGYVQSWIKGLTDGLTRAVGAQLVALDDRLRLLEDTAGNLHYCGVFKPGVQYRRGNFVTYGGSLWHCNVDTDRGPTDSKDWTLAVKRGQNGRDGNEVG
jgi:hypothetical protein